MRLIDTNKIIDNVHTRKQARVKYTKKLESLITQMSNRQERFSTKISKVNWDKLYNTNFAKFIQMKNYEDNIRRLEGYVTQATYLMENTDNPAILSGAYEYLQRMERQTIRVVNQKDVKLTKSTYENYKGLFNPEVGKTGLLTSYNIEEDSGGATHAKKKEKGKGTWQNLLARAIENEGSSLYDSDSFQLLQDYSPDEIYNLWKKKAQDQGWKLGDAYTLMWGKLGEFVQSLKKYDNRPADEAENEIASVNIPEQYQEMLDYYRNQGIFQ